MLQQSVLNGLACKKTTVFATNDKSEECKITAFIFE